MRTPQWIRSIRVFWQRGRRGWADEDTWNFNNYLCDVLAGGLRKLAEDDIGYPDEFPGGHDAWNAKLREWAAVFAAKEEESPTKPWTDIVLAEWYARDRQRYERQQQALREIAEWFGALWS